MARRKSKGLFLRKIKEMPVRILIPTGIFLVVAGSSLRSYDLINSLFKPSLAVKQATLRALPETISIPSVGIETPVKPGGVVDGQWRLAEDAAMVMLDSGKPGEGFNTVIYAHSKERLFANLKSISVGEKILLQDRMENDFTYEVFSIEWIKPQQTEKLYSDLPNTLTLFTCDGWFDETRFLVKAKMVSPLDKITKDRE